MLLEKLSTAAGNSMAPFMRDVLNVLLQLLTNGNSVRTVQGERRLVRRFGTSGVETPEVQTRSRTLCAVLWEVLAPRDKSGIVRAGNVITCLFLVSVSRSVS